MLLFLNVAIIAVYSLAMYFIYVNKWPFFEQYRISTEPWPWETDSQAWRKLLAKSIKMVALNSLVVGPAIVILDCLMAFDVKMQMQDLP